MPIQISLSNAIGALQGLAGGGPGPGPGPGYTPPLDAYSNTILAYSVRKLSSTYSGPCIQVRRESDGLTQDIGFDSNGLIATADIVSFCSGSVGTVAVWYDQGSLGQNATQSDPLKQPTVYSGTDFFYLGEAPYIQATGTEQFEFSITYSGNWTNLSVIASTSGGDTGWTYGNTGGAGIGSINAGSTEVFLYYGGISSISGDSRSQNLYSLYFDNSGIDWFRNAVGNTGVGSGVSGFSWDTFMSRRVADSGRMAMQEFLMWDTDLIASQEILETNLNDYYQVTNLPYYSSGFLADYPDAAVAYSVRQLSNTAIKCMRVRRAVAPFDEKDIGFTAGGDLDEAAIVAFGGSDELRVSAWYDQSGQSRHATQINPTSQPQIYDGAAVITDSGKPAIYAIDAGTRMNFVRQDIADASVLLVSRTSVSASNEYNLNQDLSPRYRLRYFSGRFYLYITGATIVGPVTPVNTRTLHSFYDSGSTVYWRTDGGNEITNVFTGSTSHDRIIGSLAGGVKFQEYILFDSNKYDNRTAIESDINRYYDVYTMYNPDAPTSGFLFDYPDASTAYSVRQLNNNATVSMRVRRAVAPFDEQDIGFVNGDLDEAAIVAFGGSDALTVSAWYDQSGNQRHATQITPGAQPQIYNGTAVITENGKPALNCDGASVGLDATFTHTVTEQSNFVVAEFVDSSSRRILSQTITGQNINADYQGTNHYIPLIRNASNSIASYASGYKAAKAAANNTQQLFGSIHSGTSITNYVNASASSIGSATLNTEFYVLRLKTGGNNEGMDGTLQEVISWSSNQSSPTNNRTGIETNINTYFSIYT